MRSDECTNNYIEISVHRKVFKISQIAWGMMDDTDIELGWPSGTWANGGVWYRSTDPSSQGWLPTENDRVGPRKTDMLSATQCNLTY